MTKFFTNQSEQNSDTLFEKFAGIANAMGDFHSFLAVTGYFRSSGYFRLRRELDKVSEIKVLVGIDLDNPFRAVQAKGTFWFGDAAAARKVFNDAFLDDIKNAKYEKDVEDGIFQMIDDLKSGRLEMRIHPSKNIHAKFYLCLPENHSEHSDGWVIMGSSNLTDQGLGTRQCHRYEMNVAMKDYDDVAFCKAEFDKLWEEGREVSITADAAEKLVAKTYLGVNPTPWEVYMKVLVTYFGAQAEDKFTLQLPDGVMDLKYQSDAVIQAYQMLKIHHGCILGDVVGLGKTVIAVMIAKRFIEENGRFTKILAVVPPSVRHNWEETLDLFGIGSYAHIVNNGSLAKVLDHRDRYLDKTEYDMVIVDEAHNFRSSDTGRYDELQRVCKSPRAKKGLVGGDRKEILLLSATAVNNSPADLRNEILLFKDARQCKIDGINDLNKYFAEKEKIYKKIRKDAQENGAVDQKALDRLYADIRHNVLDKITVRRTRHNIEKHSDYRADLQKQGITFPHVLPPEPLEYQLAGDLDTLFWTTYRMLEGSCPDPLQNLTYARYRAIEFLEPKFKSKYKQADHVSEILQGVYRTMMIKRLESSFHAFRCSIDTFLRITKDMLRMFDENKVLIIPELNVGELLEKGLNFDEIVKKAIENHGYSENDVVYPAAAFKPELREMLSRDRELLEGIKSKWASVKTDPKLDKFLEVVKLRLLDKSINPSGKLIIFSESVDTVNYLERELKAHLHCRFLAVSGENRNAMRPTIRANFDANVPVAEQKNDYDIVITSDALAEGVNLHRANIVVNYDTPWNSTRLIQRLGRVNRIGSKAKEVYNFLFYPSKAGDQVLALTETSLIKAQGFQSALGEDGQIFSVGEIVHEFEMFDPDIEDETDRQLEYLRLVRELYATDRAEYEKIKAMPPKIRCFRKCADGDKPRTVVYISSQNKNEFSIVENGACQEAAFDEATLQLKCERDENAIAPAEADRARHFADVAAALESFERHVAKILDTEKTFVLLPGTAPKTVAAFKFTKDCLRLAEQGRIPDGAKVVLSAIEGAIYYGIYSRLISEVADIAKMVKNTPLAAWTDDQIAALWPQMLALYEEYLSTDINDPATAAETSRPAIIISETFV